MEETVRVMFIGEGYLKPNQFDSDVGKEWREYKVFSKKFIMDYYTPMFFVVPTSMDRLYNFERMYYNVEKAGAVILCRKDPAYPIFSYAALAVFTYAMLSTDTHCYVLDEHDKFVEVYDVISFINAVTKLN